MRTGFSGRLSAALTCVLLLAGGGVQAAAPPDAALDALRDIATKTQDATRETIAAHAARRDTDTATIQATKSLRGRFDATARRAVAAGYADDAAFSRKSRRVGDLLANLERAAASPRDASLPALIPTVSGLVEGAAGAHVARSCATALAVAPGVAIDATLAPAGVAGSTLWLRIAPAKARFARIDTTPSALDTEITVFGANCPATDREAVATNDDAFGLAAAVAIDTEHTPGFHYVRVRNLSRAAGAVVARVGSAGAIVGRVTDVRNGQPIAASVFPATPDGYILPGAGTDESSGLYLLTVDPGSYYVLVESLYSPDFNYVSELYPNAACAPPYVFDLSVCDTASATLLTLADGQQIAGIDVALGIGARVAGVVRDATTGAPLANANVAVYEPGTNFPGFAVSSDAAGRYLIPGLLTGNYIVVVSRDGYGSQMWDHVTCGGETQTQCDFASGTPLALVRDTLTSGIDFDLPTEAHLHVTLSTSDGAPYPAGAWVLSIYDQSGAYVAKDYEYGTEADSQALSPGTYRTFVTALGYFGQLWNGIDCLADCTTQLNQGTLITLAQGQIADVAFALRHVPRVTGTITDAATHVPLPGVTVMMFSTDFGQWANGYTDSAGQYVMTPPTTGNYYVWANSGDHRGTLYPDVPCVDSNVQNCDTGAATPVAITYGGPDANGIDIAMPLDGSLSGHVVLRTPDGMNLDPLLPRYAFVEVSTVGGSSQGTGFTQTDGSYQITNLPEGEYYAIVQGDVFGQVYPQVDCDPTTFCSPLQGSPVTVASGTDAGGIDFDPAPLYYIFGRVTDAGGAPIAGAVIDVWHAQGPHCGIAITNADGYYAATDNLTFCVEDEALLSTDVDSSVYENEVYDDILCPQGSVYLGLCSLDGATPVPFPTTLAPVIANFTLGLRPDPIMANGFDP